MIKYNGCGCPPSESLIHAANEALKENPNVGDMIAKLHPTDWSFMQQEVARCAWVKLEVVGPNREQVLDLSWFFPQVRNTLRVQGDYGVPRGIAYIEDPDCGDRLAEISL